MYVIALQIYIFIYKTCIIIISYKFNTTLKTNYSGIYIVEQFISIADIRYYILSSRYVFFKYLFPTLL